SDRGFASDQRTDLALARLLVEVDAISIERVAFLLRLVAGFAVGLLLGAAHRPRLGHAWPLGDAMTDVVDGIVAGHVLLLQEVGSVALALRENRDQHICSGHLFPTGRLA